MRSLLPSLRYTIRLLLRSPGFTITCVLILGFGIGLNAAIFSLINAVILKPLPYPNPERLVRVSQPYQNNPLGSTILTSLRLLPRNTALSYWAVADREC
jgi:hypothetical protein